MDALPLLSKLLQSLNLDLSYLRANIRILDSVAGEQENLEWQK